MVPMPEPGDGAVLLALLEEHQGWRKRFYENAANDVEKRLLLLYAAGRTALAIASFPSEHTDLIRDPVEPLDDAKDTIVASWMHAREIASQGHTKFIAVGAEFEVRIGQLALHLLVAANRCMRARLEGRMDDAIAAYGEALGAFEQIGREWKALSLRVRRGRKNKREARRERYDTLKRERPDLNRGDLLMLIEDEERVAKQKIGEFHQGNIARSLQLEEKLRSKRN